MKIAIAVATLFTLPTAAATDAVNCLAYLGSTKIRGVKVAVIDG